MEQLFTIRSAEPSNVAAMVALLHDVDLLTHDILVPDTHYWVAEDHHRQLIGVAGVEWGQAAALLRSVAVTPALRGHGVGKLLVQHAVDLVRIAGYERVYLFSTRSGTYWQRLGFQRVPLEEVAHTLSAVPQVLRFHAIGKLARETAWRKDFILNARPA